MSGLDCQSYDYTANKLLRVLTRLAVAGKGTFTIILPVTAYMSACGVDICAAKLSWPALDLCCPCRA